MLIELNQYGRIAYETSSSQMTKKIWSCDVVLWYATKEEPEKRLRMKFENVPGNIPNECYNKAIVLLNEKVKEATVLGGCATFNFEE
jgi:hypothetical protein